jgi:peptide/nickel transport system permease protein
MTEDRRGGGRRHEAERRTGEPAGRVGPARQDPPADPESGLPEAVGDLVPPGEPGETGGAPRPDGPPGPAVPTEERPGAAPAPAARAERAATALDRPRAGVPAPAVALGVVLPGGGHLLAGSLLRGVALLFAWALLLGAAWIGRGVLFRPRALDEWVAVVTVALGLAAVWGFALRDLLLARAAAARGDEDARGGDSQWAIAARHFRRNSLAMAGLVTVVLLYLVALLAPLIAPFDPIAQGDLVGASYMAPGSTHWLGTDQFARDMLSRIVYGARISLTIGFVAVAIAIVLGSLLGAVAGYLGGRVDAVVMRFTDMVMAFPRLVLLIMIIALFEPTLGLIIAVLGLTQWPGTARLVRGEVLSLREQEYIQAARALGFGRRRIILRHLIPNVLAPVIVAATLGIGNTIVLEAGLSFLGLGIQPPTPSWGTLVADGRQNLIGAWWVATFPGLAIVVTVLAFNLVGDGLRDAMDPRLRS